MELCSRSILIILKWRLIGRERLQMSNAQPGIVWVNLEFIL